MEWGVVLEVALQVLRSRLYPFLPNSVVSDLFQYFEIDHGGDIYSLKNDKYCTNQGWASPHLRELVVNYLPAQHWLQEI